jgi:23S rRNA pseudouridine2605 synthase
MNRSRGPKGRKPHGRDGAGQDRRASGRGSGNFRQKSFARGNAPIEKAEPARKAEPGLIRLNKYISNSGVCSRREADTYIAAGNVTVNGKTITEMGYQVQLTDEVRFDGRLLQAEKKEYILLNKPKNFITTTRDEQGRRTVMELISGATRARLVPVGRLDRNTTGLLLFTNDGELAKKLTHPRHGVRKIYHVELNRNLKAEDLRKIQEGLELEDGPIKADEASYIDGSSKREVGVEIHSGRNRIVRRIFEHLGYEVVKLDRVVFAGLTKKDLPRGHWRPLTKQEVINLGMIQ